MTTENRNYNVPEPGETDWHEPVNENWHLIDDDIQGLYDGQDLDRRRRNVGAMVGGTFHDNGYTDGGYGIVFEAADLYLDSVVVNADLSEVSDPDLTIELRQYEEGATDPTVVDSTTVTVSGGPERVELGFTVPASGEGDPNDQYVLQRGAPAGEAIPLRRRLADEGDWSEEDFADETYADPSIDFLQGTLNSGSASGAEPVGSWYYFFDWLVGDPEPRLATPWSTDVDEIYMRPRDPTEEYDDVSPRALWIDTS